MKRLASVLIGALVIAIIFVVARPLSGVSGGGPLLLAAVALGAGVGAARVVRPAAKDDLLLWLVLLGVVIGATYLTMTFLGSSRIPGSEGGPAQ